MASGGSRGRSHAVAKRLGCLDRADEGRRNGGSWVENSPKQIAEA